MRKACAIGLMFVVAAFGMPVGAFAAPKAARQQQGTGGVQGDAKDSAKKNLPGVKVQVRAANGQLAASGTTNASGEFAFSGLTPGNYTIEVVDAAGNIVGISSPVAIASGATATVSVTAVAAGAIAAAGSGGAGLFGLGTIGTIAVLGGAAAATVATIIATKGDASPSK